MKNFSAESFKKFSSIIREEKSFFHFIFPYQEENQKFLLITHPTHPEQNPKIFPDVENAKTRASRRLGARTEKSSSADASTRNVSPFSVFFVKCITFKKVRTSEKFFIPESHQRHQRRKRHFLLPKKFNKQAKQNFKKFKPTIALVRSIIYIKSAIYNKFFEKGRKT